MDYTDSPDGQAAMEQAEREARADAEALSSCPSCQSLTARLKILEWEQDDMVRYLKQECPDHPGQLGEMLCIECYGPARIHALEAQVETLTKARDEALKLNYQQQPCEVCEWPRPMDVEHNICECCGFQPHYDDPTLYRATWDGKWWSPRHKPLILEAATAQLAQLQGVSKELHVRADGSPILKQVYTAIAKQLDAILSGGPK